MEIEAYSKDYDVGMDVVNNGMSGKVFINDGRAYHETENLDEAFKLLARANCKNAEMTYCYNENGQQLFKRFKVDCLRE